MKLALRMVVVALVAIVVFAIAGVAATWAPDRSVDSLKARWAQPPSQFIDVAGLQVHLRDEGPRDDPIPIVLLHGTSASLHTWDGWVQTLSKTRRVIRFDLPAFGLTGPNPQNDYSIKSYVAFVTAMMDKLAVQRFVVGGNSLGGQIAWETAHALPERVDRLILVDSSGYAFVPKSMPLGFRIARLPLQRNVMEYTLPRGIIKNSIENVYGDPSLVTPALVDRYFDLTLRAGNRKALGYRMAQGFASDEAQIKSLKLPTLILWGAKDRLIPPESGQNFARDIAGSKLVMFDALGHVPHEENVQSTLAEVVKFLGQ
jgi:pimeloyl-ACP methyl ester carboxylesterase